MFKLWDLQCAMKERKKRRRNGKIGKQGYIIFYCLIGFVGFLECRIYLCDILCNKGEERKMGFCALVDFFRKK